MMEKTTAKLILCLDDSPGRFDEFTRLCDEKGLRWVITHDQTVVSMLLPYCDAILLDHDMPLLDGVQRSVYLSEMQLQQKPPVVVVSTTNKPGAREKMCAILIAKEWRVLLSPADQIHCEKQWLEWLYQSWNTLPSQASIQTSSRG